MMEQKTITFEEELSKVKLLLEKEFDPEVTINRAWNR